MTTTVKRHRTTIGWMLVTTLFALLAMRDGVVAGLPANKAAAAGSTTKVFAPGQDVVLLSKTVKTGARKDFVLQATAECSIVTNVETIGDDDQSAYGHIEMWVEINGRPVKVAPDDAQNGKVVFCDRAYRRQTTGFDDNNDDEDDKADTIRTFFSTRSTHAFNWVALSLPQGVHTITLKANLDVSNTCVGGLPHQPACPSENSANPATLAEAVVGARTLVIEPAHFANNADLVG